MQGYTDAAWRSLHAELFGGADEYYAPFARIERGQARRRDIREVSAELNNCSAPVAQVIFKNAKEFTALTEALVDTGVTRIDLNLGCPFPPQVKKGRGAGMLLRPDELERVADAMEEFPDVEFSAKMRTGVDRHDQWSDAMRILNTMDLYYLTVHPRTAAQQYDGPVDMEAFEEIMDSSVNPVVLNAGILTPDDVLEATRRYPSLHGIMAGRGLLARPSLFAEVRSGVEWDSDTLNARILEMYARLLEHYASTLCGDTQILSKIKPYWHYLAPRLDRRAEKAIRKATTMASYTAATINNSNIFQP